MNVKSLRTARTASQVAFFLLFVFFLVGSFCSASLGGQANITCSLGMLQLTIAAQHIYIATAISGIILLVVTILLGRVFCGWACPFGSLLDWLQKPLARFRFKKADLPKSLTAPDNRGIKYGVLGGVLVAAGVLRYPAFCTICPVGATCRSAGLQGVNIGLETAVVPLIASTEVIHKRFWCRVLCPIGALLGLVSRFSFLKVRLPWDRCTGCKRCEQVCPMQNQTKSLGTEQLKTDPAVLRALVESGAPDAIDRPAPFETLPSSVREALDKKNRSISIPAAECTRCYACADACPVLRCENEKTPAVLHSPGQKAV